MPRGGKVKEKSDVTELRQPEPFKFAHGQMVRDTITELTGVITGRTDYISGCAQYLITSKVKEDGTLPPQHWVDEDRLVVIEHPRVELEVRRAGFDAPAPMK